MPTAKSGSRRLVFWSSRRISTTSKFSRSLVKWTMLDFEQLDALLDRHVQEFFGRQVGQFHAGLVDGRQLLLLMHLVGDVADGDDQVPRRAVRLPQRGGVDLEVAVVLAPQHGTGALAGGQGRMEGAEIGAEDFRASQAP